MKALKDWMKSNGHNISDLAKACDVDRSSISRIVSGQSIPDVKLAFAIQKATGGRIEAAAWVHIKRKRK